MSSRNNFNNEHIVKNKYRESESKAQVYGNEIDEGLARGLTVSRRSAASATESDLECRS